MAGWIPAVEVTDHTCFSSSRCPLSVHDAPTAPILRVEGRSIVIHDAVRYIQFYDKGKHQQLPQRTFGSTRLKPNVSNPREKLSRPPSSSIRARARLYAVNRARRSAEYGSKYGSTTVTRVPSVRRTFQVCDTRRTFCSGCCGVADSVMLGPGHHSTSVEPGARQKNLNCTVSPVAAGGLPCGERSGAGVGGSVVVRGDVARGGPKSTGPPTSRRDPDTCTSGSALETSHSPSTALEPLTK